MIIRILALDPKPQAGRSDVLCYQVPEKSREYEVLVMMFQLYGIEHTQLSSNRKPADPSKKPRKKKVKTT